MIAVVGASSKLGSRVAKRLLAEGQQVRAVSRAPIEKLTELKGLGAEIVQADLRDPSSLARVVEGADTVFAAAHALAPPDSKNTVWMVDREGNRRLIDAAVKAGVGHFVFTSVWVDPEKAPCTFVRIKGATEEYLRGSGLRATVVRPTVFMESHVLDMFGEPLRATGKVQVFGPGQTSLNYISVDDIADGVVDLLQAGPPADFRAVTIAGSESFTRMQTIAMLEKALGKKAKISHVPVAMMRAMKVATRPFNPALSCLVEFSVMENTRPEVFAWDPADADMVGETRLQTVIERWAAESPAE
jgi:uncharacterized protein YbjT (DUF2867 family)